MQYSDVNPSVTSKDSTYSPFWSLISECQQAEKISSSTQRFEDVYIPSIPCLITLERTFPSHFVFLRWM